MDPTTPNTPTPVMLVTGEYFDHLAPDPSVINLDVLEHGLQAPRFNGQTLRPITIAEHSLRVRRIAVELIGPTPSMFEEGQAVDVLERHAALLDGVPIWALLHDAHEALVPWGDCLRPGKTPEMREAEDQVDSAIRLALGVSLPDERTFEIVKTADAIALYFEALLWQPGAIDWAPDVFPWGSDAAAPISVRHSDVIPRFMPLIAPRPGECWRTEVEALLGKR